MRLKARPPLPIAIILMLFIVVFPGCSWLNGPANNQETTNNGSLNGDDNGRQNGSINTLVGSPAELNGMWSGTMLLKDTNSSETASKIGTQKESSIKLTLDSKGIGVANIFDHDYRASFANNTLTVDDSDPEMEIAGNLNLSKPGQLFQLNGELNLKYIGTDPSTSGEYMVIIVQMTRS